ncbi:hypothetical protein TRIP_B350294 [uncultured Desulfatiglans sp.]|uniref:Uncharacterized protein n=1 Tax=Uncultured Desulfatiglans sp. TaxID=1748965 RepID=A0A653AB56_UNCDX|nr:hypothetical protein TRIP_B350294 [uncultured Desulfatiglans sp.]
MRIALCPWSLPLERTIPIRVEGSNAGYAADEKPEWDRSYQKPLPRTTRLRLDPGAALPSS